MICYETRASGGYEKRKVPLAVRPILADDLPKNGGSKRAELPN